jgi:hypothetical protein
MKKKILFFRKERFCMLMLGTVLFITAGFAQNIMMKGVRIDANNGSATESRVSLYSGQESYVYAVGVFLYSDPNAVWKKKDGRPLVSINNDGIYGGYINFPTANSPFLILPNNNDDEDWSGKWGLDDNGTFVEGGNHDIKSLDAGLYRVTVDLNEGEITMVSYDNLGVVGTFNNWGDTGPDVPMIYNSTENLFEATLAFAAGDQFKFRLNGEWNTNWGENNGYAEINASTNMQIANAGIYKVTLDPIRSTYIVDAGSSSPFLDLERGRNWYLSSPVSNAIANTAFAGANYVEYYDETSTTNQTIDGWVGIANSTTSLEPGKGYVVWADDGTGDVTYTFTGGLNTGNVSVPLTRTAGVEKEGFNLVGNPYMSHIDWNAVSGANSAVEPTIWYRTTNNTDYYFCTYNGTSGVGDPADLRYIPPMQGFWVRAAAGGGTLNFTPAAITGNTGNTLRASSPDTRPLIRLQLADDAKTDRIVIFADENAQDGFDRYDSEKMFDTDAALYTKVGGEKLIFNGLGAIVEGLEIPLGFVTGHSGTYSISATEAVNLGDLQPILKDNVLNTEFNLSSGEAYGFTSDATDNTSRFSVVFRSKEVGNMPNPVEDEIAVYARNSTLYVESPVPVKQVQVYDLLGRLQYSTKEQIIYNVTSGIHIVKVETANGTVNRKVTVK